MGKTLNEAMYNLSERLPIENIDVRKRLDRAYDIVRMLGSGYELKKKGDRYEMYKESTSLLTDNSVTYTITNTSCSCPDANSPYQARICKHRLAVMLIEEMETN